MSKKIYTIVSRGFCSSGACFGVLSIVMMLLGSCRDESLTTMHPGPEISFSLSGAAVRPITRTGGDREDTDMVVVDSLLGVLPLQTEDGGRELYLHAFLSGSDRAGEGRVLTRAAPVDGMGFYDSFGVLASVYSGAWDESSCFPDYMYNVMVTKSSSWTTSYYWPGGGRNVRFFAYAPYNWEGIVLSGKDVAGTPTITCSVPDDVPDQKDLLVAVSGEMPGNTSSTAPLNFRHVLTAVRFVTGDDMLAGRITKITLKNVYGKAVYLMGGTSWRDFGSVKSFSQTPDKEVSGQPGEEITGGVTTFMMIPQQLPSGASIEIVYTDGLSSTSRTLRTSIAGKSWPMGKTITYRISTTSISVVSEFSVTSSGNFTHEGGTVNYTVRSFATVSGGDGSSQKVEMKWSAEFVEEDGVGVYHAIPRPFWLTGFTGSGNGGASQHEATAETQQGVTENPHNSKLQIAEDINAQTGKTPYNLSNSSGEEAVENTANCYLVNAPGIYSLPLVYGNGIKSGNFNTPAYNKPHFKNHLDKQISNPYIYNNSQCNPTDAILLWQDEENLVTEVRLSSDKKRLEFKVDGSTIRQGNAVVAVRGNGKIMWSWHVWVTDYKLGEDIRTMYSKNNKGYAMMPVNIGWCDGETTTYAGRKVLVRFTQAVTGMTKIVPLVQEEHIVKQSGNNPYFQFGRKDPMPGRVVTGPSSVTSKPCHGDYTFKVQKGKVPISTGIMNPHVFYTDPHSNPNANQNWTSETRVDLWGCRTSSNTGIDASVSKTIYDPSPSGFCLPASGAFSATTINGNDQSTDRNINGDRFITLFANNQGGYFYCKPMKASGNWDITGGTLFFPNSLGRHNKSGKIIPTTSYYWTATAQNQNAAPVLCLRNNVVSPPGGKSPGSFWSAVFGRAGGFSVRPVRE
ncbi:fimbrillin family protein [Bacteroides fragilis]|uniref:fimbrillin family protein n=1 Tax=Bacteroides fragilis TaxID=817 RepID=UPI0018AB7BC5|nr:fimbrillin family protein [Bacteroides fragilis]